MMSDAMDRSPECGESQPHANPAVCDPWRRRMRRIAERLRLLDEARFELQIGKIESCLQRDAEWGLEDALRSCDRWQASLRSTKLITHPKEPVYFPKLTPL